MRFLKKRNRQLHNRVPWSQRSHFQVYSPATALTSEDTLPVLGKKHHNYHPEIVPLTQFPYFPQFLTPIARSSSRLAVPGSANSLVNVAESDSLASRALDSTDSFGLPVLRSYQAGAEVKSI